MSKETKDSPVQSHLLWHQAWMSIWENRAKVIAISVLFIFLPQLLTETTLAGLFQTDYAQLKSSADQGGLSISQVLATLQSGLWTIFLSLLVTVVFMTLAYICIVRISESFFKSQPTPSLKELVMGSLSIVPKTFFIMTVLLIVFGMTQAVLPPLVLVLAPLIMAPTIYIIENEGALSTLRSSFSLKFIKGAGLPKISVYFTLLGYVGFLILSLYLAFIGSDFILNADLYFPFMFNTVTQPISGLPFSAVYLFFELFFLSIMCFAFAYFVTLTTSFYYYIKNRNTRLPPEGIEA